MRLPIQMIEQVVLDLLNCTLSDEAALLEHLGTDNFTVEQIDNIRKQGKQFALKLITAKPDALKTLLQKLI